MRAVAEGCAVKAAERSTLGMVAILDHPKPYLAKRPASLRDYVDRRFIAGF